MPPKQVKALAVVKAALEAVQALLEAIEEPVPPEDNRGFVDPCAYLGESVSKQVLYRACRNGELTASKRGKRWLARRGDIDLWVQSSKKPVPQNADLDAMIADWHRVGAAK